MNEQKAAQGPNSRTVIFTYVANLALLVFAIFLWIDESRISDDEFLMFSGLTILPLLNIYTIYKYCNSSLDNAPGVIGLYFKRKRLEEEQKIRELEKSDT